MLINLPTCIDCDRVVRSPGRCRTCALASDLARRSALAAARERAEQAKRDGGTVE